MIYLDYAANHPAEPEVLARFCAVESAFPGNPNSAHPAGRAAKAELERVTASAAELLGAKPEEIIFTSGATEANNLAIKGLARASRHVGRHIISTALEHSSVSGSLTCLQEQGYEIDLVPIGRDGRVAPEEFRALLRPDTVLAAVTAVDSELGVVQPIPEMREILKDFPNCRLHVDATQAIGRIPFSFKGLDTMALAAHKFGGINGSGILVKRADLVLEPQMHGGVSATLYRSGTPALALDASTELALRMALEGRERHWVHAERLNRRLREELSKRPGVRINSPEGAVPYILNISVDGIRGAAFQRALAEREVCVSVKSACSVEGTPSRAVFAVSRDRKNALSSWRISLSWPTTDEEITEFLRLFDECRQQLSK